MGTVNNIGVSQKEYSNDLAILRIGRKGPEPHIFLRAPTASVTRLCKREKGHLSFLKFYGNLAIQTKVKYKVNILLVFIQSQILIDPGIQIQFKTLFTHTCPQFFAPKDTQMQLPCYHGLVGINYYLLTLKKIFANNQEGRMMGPNHQIFLSASVTRQP